ncbi:MAG TPA: hypothetical protein VFZ32_03360 [Micromonosporaceae bacterium]
MPTAEQPSGAAAGKPNTDAIADTLARLTSEAAESKERQRLMGRLVAQVAGRAREAGWLPGPQRVLGAAIDTLLEIAERLPVRDLDTLRAHHPGLSENELADRIIRNASRTTAAVGAAGGGVAAVEWVAPPTLLSAPVLITTETIAVAAVELKLIGELHEVYRVPVRGSAVQRATALLTSWASRRGISPLNPGSGMSAVLSTATRKEIRDRLLRRFGRNLTTLAPLLAGAAIGAELNRRATRAVGEQIRNDLRRKRPGQVIDGVAIPGPAPHPDA